MKKRNGITKILLSDFGLTCKISCFDRSKENNNELCYANLTKLTGGIGTALYAAPEQIISNDYGPMVIIF